MQAFVYTPGLVYAPAEPQHSYQRRFLGHTNRWHVAANGRYIATHTSTEVSVYRDAEHDCGRLTISVTTPSATSEITANLTPTELRDIAQRLLDAAADIEQHPAAKLPARRREEVPA